MTHRTVICVVLVVVVAALAACEDDAGTTDCAASTTERKTGTVERHNAPPPDQDVTTFPELITDADFIGMVRLVSVVPAVVETEPEAHIRPMPGTQCAGALKFTFDVRETYKSTVHNSPSRVVALVGSYNDVWTREEAQATADRMLRERNTRWDDRDAIVFLGASSLEFPNTASNDLYYMGFVDYTLGYGDVYSLASERIRLLLPEAKQTGDRGSSTERRFLTGLPTAETAQAHARSGITSTTERPSIALSDLKSQINTINGLLQANPSADYLWCLSRKYKRDREEVEFAKEGKVLNRPYTFEETIGSGLPTDSVVVDDTWHNDFGGGMVSQTRFLGQDAHLFEIGETTRTFTEPVYATLTNLLAAKPSREFTRIVKPLETTRPLPADVYNLTWRYKMGSFVLCDPDNSVDHTLIVTVTAPSGTLHEALFDPVTDGSAVAADSSNGLLKSASFTDANGDPATIHRISYDSAAVTMTLTPDTAITGHTLDFIALDGSVSLSLNAADATLDPANNTLSWPISEQPWHDGDKLMLRITLANP
ncbi:MAG: hypothetical protein F4X72_13735 [Dehalococcoidia bacterium]|nr:hypothetical protein [Dehalococcoidia bacterium]